MTVDLGSDPRARLAELLREAEAAHAEFEASLGRRDDDWSAWYAQFILQKLQTDSA